MGDLSPNFSRHEFACRCQMFCGGTWDTVDAELIKVLEDVRAHFGQAITINSGCRCSEHNAEVGGSIGSQHLLGKACDFIVKGIHADAVYDYLNNKYFDKYGIGRYNGRTHIDVRFSPVRWDKR